MSKLVIVESPAKAKTIKKYLGSGYEVVASMGHVRDLPKSKLSVDVDNDFKPVYTDIKGKEELIASLKDEAKKADFVYLATDADREGEAISWHLAQMLGLPMDANDRVTFNEITKTGVTNGMAHPRSIGIDGKKTELHSKEEADAILARVEGADYIVTEVKKSVRRKSPAPPFTTSTMQQEASKKLGFAAAKTMKTAQTLYEGVEIENMGAVGLITYMRTDSLRISDEARAAAYKYIEEVYGKKYVPSTPKIYKTKAGAQDAHEAIRPSMPELTPAKIKDSLTPEQFKLYRLIWERFIASQMESASLDTVSAAIDANGCTFKATGFSVKFDGFTVLYEETKDDEENKVLPVIEKGDKLKLKAIEGNQHFTQPPARYTEATLIKALEENGIGRPSTYAPTISTITNRFYVERDGKQLKPTGLGIVTTQVMKDHFKHIVDTKFTANMESNLDKVETGEADWVQTLHDFYDDFDATLKKAETDMDGKRIKVPDEETDEVCEVCGKPMVIKIGRFGKFLACSGFPECTNTKKIIKPTGGICPKCGKKILQKKSKKGKKYFGCEDNPNCDFMTWDTPVSDKCPKCNDGTTLFKKGGKLFCLKEGCGYEVAVRKDK